MKRLVSFSAGLLLVCVLVGGVDAQDTLYELESPNPSEGGWFGYNCGGLGDVDSLGHEDIGAAATYESPGGILRAGMAYVFSGETGGLLYSLTSPNAQINGEFGWIAGLGDVNGDGCDDFVVTGWREWAYGLNAAGRVYVYSGATGDTLYSLVSPTPEFNGRFGTSAAGAGDVNNDGYPDFIVAAWYEDYAGVVDAGQAHIFSGPTGALIWTLDSPNPTTGGRFGSCPSGIGDANGDGCDDVAVAAWRESPGGISHAGMAYVFGGATGDTLYSLFPPDAQTDGYFGGTRPAGDVDGDGYGDVIVDAWGLDVGVADAGRAYIFEGPTGALLHTLDSPQPVAGGAFGMMTWGGEDYDNDGYADVVVGAPFETASGVEYAGRAYVFSGLTGQLMVELTSPAPEVGGNFGYYVGEGADANGVGAMEVIIAAPEEDGGASDAGRVYVFDGTTVPIELASFRAQVEGAEVRLVWVTLTEQDNLGFNVERALAEHAGYARLNDELIPGAGTTTVPHTYSYLDKTVERGCTYWYQLEDVALTGERAVHGPIQVEFPSSPALALSVLGGSEPAFALSLPEPGRASLDLYNVSGRLVARLWEGQAEAGVAVVRPDVCRTLAEGVYTAILSQHGMTAQRRVVIAH